LKMGSLGYTVALNCRTSVEQAQEVAAEIKRQGAEADVFVADVGNAEDVKNMLDAIRNKLGPLSVLVNNAGVVRDNILLRMKDDEWEDVLKSDLSSAFYCTREAIRDMTRAKWG